MSRQRHTVVASDAILMKRGGRCLPLASADKSGSFTPKKLCQPRVEERVAANHRRSATAALTVVASSKHERRGSPDTFKVTSSDRGYVELSPIRNEVVVTDIRCQNINLGRHTASLVVRRYGQAQGQHRTFIKGTQLMTSFYIPCYTFTNAPRNYFYADKDRNQSVQSTEAVRRMVRRKSMI